MASNGAKTTYAEKTKAELLPSHQDGKTGKEGDVAVMGGKDGVLALASVLESPQKKIFEETIFGENGKKSRSWRRRFVRGFWPDGSLNVSSQRATEPQQICAVVKPTVEQPSEEASAELVHAIEVARQAAAIVARAAGKAAAERKEKARAVAKDFKDRETAARVREHQAARKAAAKARKYKDHDGQCWERVGSYATAKAWYFKCLQETQMAKVMPAPVATVVVGPVVANAVGDSLGAKSAVAKSHKEEAAAVYKARREAKQAAEDAAISKAQRKAKKQAAGQRTMESANASADRRVEKKAVSDARTLEKASAQAATLAQRAARKANIMMQEIRDVHLQSIQRSKFQVAALALAQGIQAAANADMARAQALELHQQLRIREATIVSQNAAVAKGLKDRETAERVRGYQVAWKIRKGKKLKA